MLTVHRTTGSSLKAKCKTLLAAALLLTSVTTAEAALFRVGPTALPSPAKNGFPLWYQDTNGLALDLCLPKNAAQLNAGACLILPPAQDPIAGINLPITFPANYPDEAFYWNATGVFDLDPANPASTRATMVLGLEAAFGGLGTVAPGQQITFGRVRFTIDAPVNGNYTITYPYGVKTFPNVVAGNEAIKFTDDIGIGNPGEFSGALQSGVGPFLRRSATGVPGGPAAAPVVIGGELFLADTGTEVAVTGSPNNTNFFEVCVDVGTLDGVNACKRLNVFTLMGKVHATPIPSPFVVNSATYARDGVSAHVNVTATASAGPGALAPKLSFGDAAGTNLIPSTLMNGPSNLNQFFGQSIPANPATLPANVIVTNSGDNPPASIKRALADEVTVTQASYDPTTRQLTIKATTSDKIAPVPALVAVGLPGSATGSDPLVPVVVAGDAAAQQLVFTIPPTVAQLPPPSVTITSPKGGNAVAVVSTATGAAGDFAAGGPIAVNDLKLIKVGVLDTQLAIKVLANDRGAAPATIRIITQPKKGTLQVTPGGSVVYTFTGAKVLGEDTFTYTVKNAAGIESNVATAIVRTIP